MGDIKRTKRFDWDRTNQSASRERRGLRSGSIDQLNRNESVGMARQGGDSHTFDNHTIHANKDAKGLNLGLKPLLKVETGNDLIQRFRQALDDAKFNFFFALRYGQRV